MYIVLSQRKDIETTYSDSLYKIYHFPSRYKNQITAGDIFVYYQGDRLDRSHRVYYGTGVVRNVYSTNSDDYYAELYNCQSFEIEVPIYLDNNGYIEQLGFDTVRKSVTPLGKVQLDLCRRRRIIISFLAQENCQKLIVLSI